MTRIISLFLIIFTAITSVPSAEAAAIQCANNSEKEALDIRVLQTELMVAALACGERTRYNDFVTRYQPQLKQGGKDLRIYFSRIYKKMGEQKLNNFVTKLANETSKNSRKTSVTVFCRAANHIFVDALAATTPRSLTEIVSSDTRFSRQHGIKTCAKKKA